MKKTETFALHRYYRRIRNWLPCPTGLKKIILCDIRENIDIYRDQNPNWDMNQIITHFGSPQDIAEAYVSDLSKGDVLKQLRIRRRIMSAVFAGVLVALILLVGFLGLIAYEQHMYNTGYIIEIIK